ncbi:transposable element Tc3 transposase [Trichonephila clavipes]|nr:transposable element Tc3 transposase [Trichonephila clavipes]
MASVCSRGLVAQNGTVMVVNVTMKREMSFIHKMLKTQVGSCSLLEKAHFANASLCAVSAGKSSWHDCNLYGLVESLVRTSLKNDEGHNVTVNGDRYRAMITNFFIPVLNNHDVQELWFQQDGATCHTARATIDLLKDTFGDRLISRFGPVNWPQRSCDLTPLGYFLWGYVKSLVYADKTTNAVLLPTQIWS